jgi:hypothetical protein
MANAIKLITAVESFITLTPGGTNSALCHIYSIFPLGNFHYEDNDERKNILGKILTCGEQMPQLSVKGRTQPS